MPKVLSKSAWFRDWIKRIDDSTSYTTDGKVIVCQACQQQVFPILTTFKRRQRRHFTKIPCSMYSQLVQHNNTAKHKANLEHSNRKKQPFIADSLANNNKDPFHQDLCNALISADIPFNKLRNPSFKNFLSKYCHKIIPADITLWREMNETYQKVNLIF